MTPAELLDAVRKIDRDNTRNHVRMNNASDRVTKFEKRIASLEETVAMLVAVVLEAR